MKKNTLEISQVEVKEYFEYRNDGYLYWKKHRKKTAIGSKAGCQDKRYWRICLNCKIYSLHRLIWIYFNGSIPIDMEIDHIDRDTFNNKIENLRLVTSSQNGLNNNASNIQYRPDCTNNPWQGRFRNKYRSCSKSFATLKEAEDWVRQNKLKAIGVVE